MTTTMTNGRQRKSLRDTAAALAMVALMLAAACL